MYDVNFDKFSVLARKATDTMTEIYIGEVSEEIPNIVGIFKTKENEYEPKNILVR